MGGFYRLIVDLKLMERCEKIGQRFEFFFGGMSPEGNGYELEDVRLERSDLQHIPQELISISREGLHMLGKPECELYDELIIVDAPPNMEANMKALSISADYNVYPNIAEPIEWWAAGQSET